MVKMQKKVFLFGAAAIVALGLIAAPVQLDGSGIAIDTAAAAGKGGGYKNDCRPRGNNGWGNGGEDGVNPGSFQGGGVSAGGPGAGESQADTKSADADR